MAMQLSLTTVSNSDANRPIMCVCLRLLHLKQRERSPLPRLQWITGPRSVKTSTCNGNTYASLLRQTHITAGVIEERLTVTVLGGSNLSNQDCVIAGLDDLTYRTFERCQT